MVPDKLLNIRMSACLQRAEEASLPDLWQILDWKLRVQGKVYVG